MKRPTRGWAKARKEAIELAKGLCDICGIDIVASGFRIEVNHKIALVDGGNPTAQDNLSVVCPPCHKPHTIIVIKRQAKTRRSQRKFVIPWRDKKTVEDRLKPEDPRKVRQKEYEKERRRHAKEWKKAHPHERSKLKKPRF